MLAAELLQDTRPAARPRRTTAEFREFVCSIAEGADIDPDTLNSNLAEYGRSQNDLRLYLRIAVERKSQFEKDAQAVAARSELVDCEQQRKADDETIQAIAEKHERAKALEMAESALLLNIVPLRYRIDGLRDFIANTKAESEAFWRSQSFEDVRLLRPIVSQIDEQITAACEEEKARVQTFETKIEETGRLPVTGQRQHEIATMKLQLKKMRDELPDRCNAFRDGSRASELHVLEAKIAGRDWRCFHVAPVA